VIDDRVSLRELMDLQVRRLDDLRSAERARQDDLRSADKEAVRTTKDAMEKRLEGLNELRTGVATKDQLDVLAAGAQRIERLVYIGMGLAIAASVAIPLLLR
jgi:hypothetical protein